MSDPFVAEIRIFPFNFAPTGWAFCNGQLLPISQNTALFSLLGTTYGGDGKSNFALPDLQGSVPIQQGQGKGLSLYDLGQTSGSETITLLQTEISAHNHFIRAHNGDNADAQNPSPNTSLARSANGFAYQTNTSANLTQLAFQALTLAGGGLPHNNLMPYLALNFCIAMQGVFPPRP
ncbi:MAG TPA: tail fiber protein [Pyrinomonadaceae bacterium]|nr:tail fiber protein [Pyrinomonadaceae bacterium]